MENLPRYFGVVVKRRLDVEVVIIRGVVSIPTRKKRYRYLSVFSNAFTNTKLFITCPFTHTQTFPSTWTNQSITCLVTFCMTLSAK